MIEFPLKAKIITSELPAFVVGIVNATPDSFYAGSRGGAEMGLRLLEEGAHILDIGGESTRPGFTPVSPEDEINRVVPVIREIKKNAPNCVISVDTRHAQVWKAAYENGADILNDISSFEDDILMEEEFFKTGCPVILMHRYHGDENTRITNPHCIEEVSDYFENKVKLCLEKGLEKSKIIVDPGIGFGKTMDENIELIDRAGELCGGKYTIMMACSRKRVIGYLAGDPALDRLQGTIDANLRAIKSGATMIRVHDVAAHVKALKSGPAL